MKNRKGSLIKRINEHHQKNKINEVKFNPNASSNDEDFDYFDNEYPDPVAEFKDFDDMLNQLEYYFHYKKNNDKSGHFRDLSLYSLVWDEETTFVNGVLDNNSTTVYMNPYFAEVLLDRMEEEMSNQLNRPEENSAEPKEYVYFKLFHGAILYAGYLALVADQLDRQMSTDPVKNIQSIAGRYNTAFNEAIQSFPKHVWELKIVREIMQKYWPKI